MTAVQEEKALKPRWKGNSYLARGKKFETVEVRFREVDTVRLHSVTYLRTI